MTHQEEPAVAATSAFTPATKAGTTPSSAAQASSLQTPQMAPPPQPPGSAPSASAAQPQAAQSDSASVRTYSGEQPTSDFGKAALEAFNILTKKNLFDAWWISDTSLYMDIILKLKEIIEKDSKEDLNSNLQQLRALYKKYVGSHSNPWTSIGKARLEAVRKIPEIFIRKRPATVAAQPQQTTVTGATAASHRLTQHSRQFSISRLNLQGVSELLWTSDANFHPGGMYSSLIAGTDPSQEAATVAAAALPAGGSVPFYSNAGGLFSTLQRQTTFTTAVGARPPSMHTSSIRFSLINDQNDQQPKEEYIITAPIDIPIRDASLESWYSHGDKAYEQIVSLITPIEGNEKIDLLQLRPKFEQLKRLCTGYIFSHNPWTKIGKNRMCYIEYLLASCWHVRDVINDMTATVQHPISLPEGLTSTLRHPGGMFTLQRPEFSYQGTASSAGAFVASMLSEVARSPQQQTTAAVEQSPAATAAVSHHRQPTMLLHPISSNVATSPQAQGDISPITEVVQQPSTPPQTLPATSPEPTSSPPEPVAGTSASTSPDSASSASSSSAAGPAPQTLKGTHCSRYAAMVYFATKLLPTDPEVKKWWSSKNSKEYRDIREQMQELTNYEASRYALPNLKDSDLQRLYIDLRNLCQNYISSHNPWTSAGKARLRYIKGLYAYCLHILPSGLAPGGTVPENEMIKANQALEDKKNYITDEDIDFVKKIFLLIIQYPLSLDDYSRGDDKKRKHKDNAAREGHNDIADIFKDIEEKFKKGHRITLNEYNKVILESYKRIRLAFRHMGIDKKDMKAFVNKGIIYALSRSEGFSTIKNPVTFVNTIEQLTQRGGVEQVNQVSEFTSTHTPAVEFGIFDHLGGQNRTRGIPSADRKTPHLRNAWETTLSESGGETLFRGLRTGYAQGETAAEEMVRAAAFIQLGNDAVLKYAKTVATGTATEPLTLKLSSTQLMTPSFKLPFIGDAKKPLEQMRLLQKWTEEGKDIYIPWGLVCPLFKAEYSANRVSYGWPFQELPENPQTCFTLFTGGHNPIIPGTGEWVDNDKIFAKLFKTGTQAFKYINGIPHIAVKVKLDLLLTNFGVNVQALRSPGLSSAQREVDFENASTMMELFGLLWNDKNVLTTAEERMDTGNYATLTQLGAAGIWPGSLIVKSLLEKSLGRGDDDVLTSDQKIIVELADQILHIYRRGLYKKYTTNIYALPARLVVLSQYLGYLPQFNCKSGKDRTGILDAEVKYIVEYINANHKVPTPYAPIDERERYNLSQMAYNSGGLEITRTNTGISGYKVPNFLGLFAAIQRRYGSVELLSYLSDF